MSQEDDDEDVWQRTALVVERRAVDRAAWQSCLTVTLDDKDDSIHLPLLRFRPTKKKNRLQQALRHWLDRMDTVKCLGSSSSSSGSSSQHQVWQAYAERARTDGYSVPVVAPLQPRTTETSDDNQQLQEEIPRGNIVTSNRDPSTSLSIYRAGRLVEGQVCSAGNDDKNSHDKAVLQTTAHLYDNLWWCRVVQGFAVERAFGFTVTSCSATAETVVLTLVGLVVPSLSLVGGRWPLYEYTQQYSVENNTAGSKAHDWYKDVGRLVCCNDVPIPWMAHRLEQYSPGCMLLPDNYLSSTADEPSSSCHVVPTMTGSLVVKCHGLAGVNTLLANETEESSIDASWWQALQTLDPDNSILWYVKVKTPVFGQYWDTAVVAINGTRRLLSLKKLASIDEKSVAKEWLAMHPLDAWVQPFRNITIVRGMGTKFVGQVPWSDFCLEFVSLMKRTLTLQAISHLVHGDIHEGNVLWNDRAEIHYRLVLIDWDEALRKNACIRQANTEEEQRRYPNELVNFAAQYTKQQLLHLFQFYWDTYYKDDEGKAGCCWEDEYQGQAQGQVAAVDERYKRLCKFLEGV